MEAHAPGPAALVVDRYPGVPVDRVPAARRDEREGGQDPRRDAPVMPARIGVAPHRDEQAAFERLDLEHRGGVAQVVLVGARALEQRIALQRTAMQEADVAGIDAAL